MGKLRSCTILALKTSIKSAIVNKKGGEKFLIFNFNKIIIICKYKINCDILTSVMIVFNV